MQELQTDANVSKTCRTQIDHGLNELSRSGKQRLKWMNHFKKYRNARFTCRHFGISPDTFYLWKKRFSPSDLSTLEDNFKMRRPKSTRSSKYKIAHLETIKQLKANDPKLGRVKIAKILTENGYQVSSSTVGRILKLIRD